MKDQRPGIDKIYLSVKDPFSCLLAEERKKGLKN